MKNKLFLVSLVCFVLVLSSCNNNGNTNSNGNNGNIGSNTPTNNSEANNIATPLKIGDKVTFTADGVSFKMAYIPGGLSFPIKDNDSGTSTVANAYWIGETELTYELWYKVRVWAMSNGYNFAYAGNESAASQEGAAPTAAKDNPVQRINWRDIMIFTNALTEWYNATAKTNYTCAYYADAAYTTPLRTATTSFTITNTTLGSQDAPYIKTDASGFRLLTNDEWELAARYKDGTNWTPGSYASGASADYNNEAATEAVAWYNTNASNDVHAVKSKLPNALGLYDMSGNVGEWTINSTDSYRVWRGGGWVDRALIMQLSLQVSSNPAYTSPSTGFRLARTAL
ncbi:MAG: SUMF1/EgtB/PvdO family nonheme iron enzyme [bacterium]